VPLARLDDVQSDSILRYGASANDGTTDARAAISAAIAAGAKNLYFPPGTYLFPNKLADISGASGLRFYGVRGATIFKSSVPAATPATGDAVFFFFSGCSDIRFEGITFDLNSILTTNANTAALGFLLCNGVHVDACDIRNGKRLGIGFNGTNRWAVTDCNLHRSGSNEGTYQNEAILNTISGGPSVGGYVANNTIRGWGTLLSGQRLRVISNDIQNWGYGAGISFNQDAGTFRPIAVGNFCQDSTGLDINNTHPSGIECWAEGAILIGNTCINNAGAGIIIGGVNTVCKGNLCLNNGNYSYGPGDYRGVGIGLTWQPGIIPAQNCVIEGNICRDSGPGYQKWGYQELETASATFSNNLIRGNQMAGNITGDYDFSGFSGSIQFSGYELEGQVAQTVNVPANSSVTAVLISVAGAQLGDMVEVSMNQTLQGCMMTGYLHAAGQVFVTLTNPTGAAVTFTGALFWARVRQKRPG
jgi:hypothetical protein